MRISPTKAIERKGRIRDLEQKTGPFLFVSAKKHLLLFQVSSVSLASEDPVDEDSVRNYYLGIADYFFTGKP